MRRRQLLLRVERVVKRADYCFFDLGAAEFLARGRQRREVELLGVAIALGQMDAKISPRSSSSGRST